MVLIIITILPVVTKDLPISPRFTPYNFLSRCKFSSLTTLQSMVELYNIISHQTKNRLTNVCRFSHISNVFPSIGWAYLIGQDSMGNSMWMRDTAGHSQQTCQCHSHAIHCYSLPLAWLLVSSSIIDQDPPYRCKFCFVNTVDSKRWLRSSTSMPFILVRCRRAYNLESVLKRSIPPKRVAPSPSCRTG